MVNQKINTKYKNIVKNLFNIFSKSTNQFKDYNRVQEGFVHKTAKLIFTNNINIGYETEIKDHVILQAAGQISIGKYCQINPYTVIYAGEVNIGDYVMIAPHCMIASGNHDYKQLDQPMRFAGWFTKGPIIIEDDVWIGANCTITDGVKIGEGSVVAANSCVVKDVEPYSIVSGVPAKIISYRKK